MTQQKPDTTETPSTEEAPLTEETPSTEETLSTEESSSTEMFSEETASAKDAESLRPEFLGEAFWDAETNTPRLKQLADSREHYRAQYQKTLNDESSVPETTDGYLKNHINEKGEAIFQLGEDTVQTIPKDDPVLQAHLAISKDLSLTDKQSDEYLSRMMVAMHSAQTPEPIDTKFEEQKLGADGAGRVAGMKNYLDLLQLPAGAKEAYATELSEVKAFMAQKAGRTVIMEALMKEGGVHNLPPQSDTELATHDEEMAEYDKMSADPDALQDNPRLRARYEKLGAKLFPG